MSTKIQKPQPKRGKPLRQILIPALGAIAGILMLLYPVVSTRIHNADQQRIANDFSFTIAKHGQGELEQILKGADEYNQELSQGVILDPFLQDVAPNSPEYQRYLKRLNFDGVMGTVRVPSAKINLPIYHGTFADTLEKGAGHLFGSSLPVGGKDSHAVITGHTGLQNATLFDHLDSTKKGDAIYLNVGNRKLKYVVDDIKVVLPNETESLKRVAGKDLVTLITCTPYGINTHRLLVTGERAPMDEVEAKQIDAPVNYMEWQWWMIALVAGATATALVMIAIIWRIILVHKRRNKQENTQE